MEKMKTMQNSGRWEKYIFDVDKLTSSESLDALKKSGYGQTEKNEKIMVCPKTESERSLKRKMVKMIEINGIKANEEVINRAYDDVLEIRKQTMKSMINADAESRLWLKNSGKNMAKWRQMADMMAFGIGFYGDLKKEIKSDIEAKESGNEQYVLSDEKVALITAAALQRSGAEFGNGFKINDNEENIDDYKSRAEALIKINSATVHQVSKQSIELYNKSLDKSFLGHQAWSGKSRTVAKIGVAVGAVALSVAARREIYQGLSLLGIGTNPLIAGVVGGGAGRLTAHMRGKAFKSMNYLNDINEELKLEKEQGKNALEVFRSKLIDDKNIDPEEKKIMLAIALAAFEHIIKEQRLVDEEKEKMELVMAHELAWQNLKQLTKKRTDQEVEDFVEEQKNKERALKLIDKNRESAWEKIGKKRKRVHWGDLNRWTAYGAGSAFLGASVLGWFFNHETQDIIQTKGQSLHDNQDYIFGKTAAAEELHGMGHPDNKPGFEPFSKEFEKVDTSHIVNQPVNQNVNGFEKLYDSDGQVDVDAVKKYCQGKIAFDENVKNLIEQNPEYFKNQQNLKYLLEHTGSGDNVYDAVYLKNQMVDRGLSSVEMHVDTVPGNTGYMIEVDKDGVEHMVTYDENLEIKDCWGNDVKTYPGAPADWYSPDHSSADNLLTAIKYYDDPKGVETFLTKLDIDPATHVGGTDMTIKQWLMENKLVFQENKKLFDWIVYRDPANAEKIAYAIVDPQGSDYGMKKELMEYMYGISKNSTDFWGDPNTIEVDSSVHETIIPGGKHVEMDITVGEKTGNMISNDGFQTTDNSPVVSNDSFDHGQSGTVVKNNVEIAPVDNPSIQISNDGFENTNHGVQVSNDGFQTTQNVPTVSNDGFENGQDNVVVKNNVEITPVNNSAVQVSNDGFENTNNGVQISNDGFEQSNGNVVTKNNVEISTISNSQVQNGNVVSVSNDGFENGSQVVEKNNVEITPVNNSTVQVSNDGFDQGQENVVVKNNVEISTIQNDQTDNGVINKNNVEISTVESNGNVVADNNVQHKIDQVVASHHDKSYTSDEFENYLKTKQDAPTKEEIQAGFGNAKYGEDMYGKKIEDMDSYQKFVKYMGREELLKS